MCDRTHLIKKGNKMKSPKEQIIEIGPSKYYDLLLPGIRGLEYNKDGEGYAYDESKAAVVAATVNLIEYLLQDYYEDSSGK